MTETQTQPTPLATAAIAIPPSSIAMPTNNAARLRNQLALDTFASPVNQNGSFEFDRVLKSGYVQRRTKTKVRLSDLSHHCQGIETSSKSLTRARPGNVFT